MNDTEKLNAFSTATDWRSIDGDIWEATLTSDWTQGRAAFGGFIIGGALRALDRLTGDDRRARTFSATLMAAVEVGNFNAHGTVLRAGRNVSVAEMQIHQNDTHAATILATFGVERDSKVHIEAEPRPDMPDPNDIKPMPYIEGLIPPCQQHFECRYTEGQLPFSRSDMDYASGYIRLRNPGGHPEAAAAALLDAFPFPFMQTMDAPAPVTTIMFTAHFLDLADADLAGNWWLRSKTVHAANGYATFETRLYRPDGKLGAWSEQLVGVYDK